MKYITRLHRISVERGPLQVARLTGEKVSHLRHLRLREELSRGGPSSHTIRPSFFCPLPQRACSQASI